MDIQCQTLVFVAAIEAADKLDRARLTVRHAHICDNRWFVDQIGHHKSLTCLCTQLSQQATAANYVEALRMKDLPSLSNAFQLTKDGHTLGIDPAKHTSNQTKLSDLKICN